MDSGSPETTSSPAVGLEQFTVHCIGFAGIARGLAGDGMSPGGLRPAAKPKPLHRIVNCSRNTRPTSALQLPNGSGRRSTRRFRLRGDNRLQGRSHAGRGQRRTDQGLSDPSLQPIWKRPIAMRIPFGTITITQKAKDLVAGAFASGRVMPISAYARCPTAGRFGRGTPGRKRH